MPRLTMRPKNAESEFEPEAEADRGQPIGSAPLKTSLPASAPISAAQAASAATRHSG